MSKKQTERKHTPLKTFQGRIFIEESGITVATVTASPVDAIARRMVSVWNSHDKLVDALQEAEKVILWAAQESRGRVKAEIVNGWIHHSTLIRAALADISK